jgi:hypothetical protein
MRKLAILVALSFAPALVGQNGVLVTVAGNGTTGSSGVGGPAVNAPLLGGAICVDRFDNIYVTDPSNNRVVKIDGNSGILTLLAGNGTAASAGDGGPATQASLNNPIGVAVDSAGDVFVAESNGNRVRAIDPASGFIYTVVGNGVAGFGGDGGPAVNASLSRPMGLALDAAANLYIADAVNMRVRMVDVATRTIKTIAGTGVNGHSPDGTPAATANLAVPYALSFDNQGNLLISELFGYAVRRVSSTTGLLSTVAGNGQLNFNGDGQPATSAALGYMGGNVASDPAGNLYFADGNGRVRRVDAASGIITTVAGNGAGAHSQSSSGGGGGGSYICPTGLGQGGPATLATLDGPSSLAFTSTGKLLIADSMDCYVFGVQLPSPLQYTGTTLSLSGQTLTATVLPIGGTATPTGTVQFAEYVPFALGPATPLATAPVIGGVATLDSAGLSAGSHQVMAIYLGDATYNGSGSVAVSVTGAGKATPSMSANVPYPVATPATISFNVVGNRGTPTGTVQVSEGATALTSVTLVNGVGSFSYTTDTPGSHQITLQYSGDVNYTSLTWTFPVTVLAQSTLTLTADKNPANTGDQVTITATLSPATASGTISFYNNGSMITSVPVANGRATITGGPFTQPIVFSFSASYSGDSAVAPSNSNTLTLTVNAVTSVAVATSGSPSAFGQPVTLMAMVMQSGATGSVDFYDGATRLGGAPVSNGASAQLVVPQFGAGNHSITAVFTGTGGWGNSTSSALIQTVEKAKPVISVTSSANPAISPASVGLTASLSPAWSGATVQLMDGQTVLGSGSAASGVFSLNVALSPGAHTITAVCTGDANLDPAISAPLTQTVQANTTITVSAPSSQTFYGQPVTYTASVAPAAASGTVQFLDNYAPAGSAPVVNGAATLTLPLPAAGIHSIQAVYSGDGVYLGSSSDTWVQIVNLASTQVSLAASPNPATATQAVVFTVTLSPATCTGSVQIEDGATVIGAATISGSKASLSTTALTVGSHAMSAMYLGDANCSSAAAGMMNETITKAPTTTSLSADSGSIAYGQTVNLTASVSPAAATGTVQFLDGATVLATLPVTNGTVPVVTATNLTAGVHTFTAVYSGDGVYSGGTSAGAAVTVSKASAAVVLTASPNPSIAGQAVTFTAAVSPSSSTGSVQFLDGSTVIGTASLANGSASLSVSPAVGTHSVTAVYSGDANHNGATSAAVAQTVNKAPSTTAISAGSGTISFGQSVSFTASVSPASATGTVQFLDGVTVIGAVALNGGSASLVVGNFAVGTHTITASYGGDGGTLASASAAVSVTVVKAATAVGLASSSNPSLNGQAVTFNAVVSPATATGTVMFQDGATVIGTVALNNGSAALSVSNLAVGSHSITAVYVGDANYNGATSAALTQSVLIATTTTLSANKSVANVDQNVKFTANVSPGAATGSFDFMDGTILLGTVPLSGNSAMLQVSSLTVGTHNVTATYSGAARYASSASLPVTVTIH